jgi:hypothetical protein
MHAFFVQPKSCGGCTSVSDVDGAVKHRAGPSQGTEFENRGAKHSRFPTHPLPYWGWGSIPDQHGRQSDDDSADGLPVDPKGADLPRIGPWDFEP